MYYKTMTKILNMNVQKESHYLMVKHIQLAILSTIGNGRHQRQEVNVTTLYHTHSTNNTYSWSPSMSWLASLYSPPVRERINTSVTVAGPNMHTDSTMTYTL